MTDKTDGTVDPSKEIKAWKAYFEYAAEDMRGESPELLVACAHRLLEMSHALAQLLPSEVVNCQSGCKLDQISNVILSAPTGR